MEIQKLSENTQFLQRMPAFRDLEYDAIRQIYFFSKKMVLHFNQVVYRKNESSKDVFIIRSGEFRVSNQILETLS